MDNVSVRYGGANTGGSCGINSAEVYVGPDGRVDIARSEFLHAEARAIIIDSQQGAVGQASVRYSRFADYDCAVTALSGDFIGNVFEDEVNRAVWAAGTREPTYAQVKFYNNWIYGPVHIEYEGDYGRESFDFENNAFVNNGNFVDVTGAYSRNLNDVSLNWWGRPLPEDPGCWRDSIPTLEATTENTSCPSGANSKYLFNVLPALDVAPAANEAGLEGNPVVPAAVDEAQLYGTGSSEFAANPTGFQADPVNTANGSYIDQVVDATVAASGMALAATRTYNSADPSVGSLGQGWSFGYDIGLTFPNSSTVVLRAPDGQQVRFTKQSDGGYAGAAGATATLKAVTGGFQVTTRASMTYSFNTAGKVTAVNDRNGSGTTFTYDAAGRLSRASNGGRYLTFSYTDGRLTRIDLPDGRWVGYGYTNGLLTSVRDLRGKTTAYGYDAAGRLTSETDPLNHQVMRLAYHPTTGRVSDQWDALNYHTTFGWDAATGTATMTDPRGKVWTDAYQGNVLTKRRDPLGRTWRYEYDTDLQLVAATDPRGFRSIYTYNDAGDLVYFHGPNGSTRTSYDANHNPIRSVNPRGFATHYSYDAAGNLTKIARPAPGATGANDTTFTYFGNGLLKTATDASGGVTSYAYNADGDLKRLTSPEGNVTTYSYDNGAENVGRLTDVTSPRGNVTGATPADFTTHYAYNAADQVTTVTDPLGRTFTSSYDDADRLVTSTDAKNHTTTYGYDAAGHTTSVQGPDATIAPATYTYDPNGNVATATDPAGRTTTYSYDDANQPTSATGPLGAYGFGYDNSGNLTTITDPAGLATMMRYTAAGQLRLIDYPGETADVAYTYDPDGNRKTMTDGSGEVSYTYNSLDQLTSVTRGGDTFSYGYTPTGLVNTSTYPTGTAMAYGYDRDGQLKTVKKNNALVASYTLTPDGLPNTATLGDGSTRTFSYDNANRLTRLQDVKNDGTTILDDTYSLDNSDNPYAITHANGSTDTYTYDALDRLTAACYNTTTCTGAADYVRWTYDAVGNRTSETKPSGTTTYTYNSTTGRLASTTAPGGAVTNYGYNARGEQTSAGSTTYSYNDAGRMVSATTGGATTTYTYDGDGRRLTATSGATTTRFLWDPRTYHLAVETDGAGTRLRDYLYGIGPIGYIGPGGSTNYYHTDAQGSVREVTSASGTSLWRYVYEPYGVVRSTTKLISTAAANPIGWAGQYNDRAGNTHLRARQYNPTLGAFTAPDPAGATTPSGTYTYANSNPMVAADPLGLWPDWGGVWDTVTDWAPTVTAVAGAGALAFPPAAPVLGPVAGVGGAVTAVDSALTAYDVCTSGKGSCGGAVLDAAINTTAAAVGASWGASGIRAWRTANGGGRVGPDLLRVGDLKLPAVPKGAVGTPTQTGKGMEYVIPRGTPEISEKVASVRIMDPVTSGKYQYPNGHAVYMNSSGQTINPLTGQTITRTDPYAHIPLP